MPNGGGKIRRRDLANIPEPFQIKSLAFSAHLIFGQKINLMGYGIRHNLPNSVITILEDEITYLSEIPFIGQLP